MRRGGGTGWINEGGMEWKGCRILVRHRGLGRCDGEEGRRGGVGRR